MSAEPPAAWPAGLGRRVLDEVDSTNAEAARLAASGAGPCWILAGFQTGGRGRRGRAWVSPRGNFHATRLLYPPGPAAEAALLGFAAALALHEALAGLTGLPDAFTLKWPNDVLLNGGKVAGILLEAAGQGAGLAHLGLGIGVNLIAAPAAGEVEPGALRPVSVLAETGIRIAPAALLDALAPAFDAWEQRLAAEGFAPLRAAWLSRAAGLGGPLTARLSGGDFAGTFAGMDDSGALLLDTPAGRRSIPAAEVHLG